MFLVGNDVKKEDYSAEDWEAILNGLAAALPKSPELAVDVSESTMVARYSALFPEYSVKPFSGAGTGASGEQLYIVEHDGIPYAFDNLGNMNSFKTAEEQQVELDRRLAHSAKHFYLTVERHHAVVKRVYQFLAAKKELRDVWCMVGGGFQLQVFFGNHTGYLATLFLSLDYLECDVDDEIILAVNWAHNNPIFEDLFGGLLFCDGIRLEFSDCE